MWQEGKGGGGVGGVTCNATLVAVRCTRADRWKGAGPSSSTLGILNVFYAVPQLVATLAPAPVWQPGSLGGDSRRCTI